MALIRSLEKAARNSKVHGETHSTYNVLSVGREKYLQINTYGSKDRVQTGVVSQTIQLDLQAVTQLMDIIKKEFQL